MGRGLLSVFEHYSSWICRSIRLNGNVNVNAMFDVASTADRAVLTDELQYQWPCKGDLGLQTPSIPGTGSREYHEYDRHEPEPCVFDRKVFFFSDVLGGYLLLRILLEFADQVLLDAPVIPVEHLTVDHASQKAAATDGEEAQSDTCLREERICRLE